VARPYCKIKKVKIINTPRSQKISAQRRNLARTSDPRRKHHTGTINATRSREKKNRTSALTALHGRGTANPHPTRWATMPSEKRFPGAAALPAGRCCSSSYCRCSRGRCSARPRGTARPAPSPASSSTQLLEFGMHLLSGKSKFHIDS
jgi:hypothetical protein